jgi:8-amino-7-oxononanoate synthase
MNLSSNDYLGLGGNATLLREFYAAMNENNALDAYAPGALSSRLLTGDSEAAQALERSLADSYQAEAALLFNSGYHANIGILPALYGKGDLILSDKLNHASIHDGLRLAAAAHKRYRHGDYANLRQLLQRHRADFRRAVIVSESVFSMDGDFADLAELIAIKRQFAAELYLDEAHAVGLYGATGLGWAEARACLGEIDFLLGTFGKACASTGAFLICSEEIRRMLINHSRSLIFTTAMPPVSVTWNRFIWAKLRQYTSARAHLMRIAQALRDSLRQHGLATHGESNIVPVLLGDAQLTIQVAESLRNQGYLALPVRPPTVPEGTSRLRLSLTAAMQWDDLKNVPTAICRAIAIAPKGT